MVRSAKSFVLVCAVLLAAHGVAVGDDKKFDELYVERSLSPPTESGMIVCYAFGCRGRYELDFTEEDRAAIDALFAKAKDSAEAERAAVAKTVAWFDRRVGPVIGTSRRVPRADFRYFDDAHNFDCVDTSTNTTSLLLVLSSWGLLRHHVVDLPRFRGNILVGQTPHNTALLVERTTGQGWSIDMWTTRYGDPAEVMRIERWMREN